MPHGSAKPWLRAAAYNELSAVAAGSGTPVVSAGEHPLAQTAVVVAAGFLHGSGRDLARLRAAGLETAINSIATRYFNAAAAFAIVVPSFRRNGRATAPPQETVMTLSKIVFAAFALVALVASNLAAEAAPRVGEASRYVETGMGAAEHGVDQAKGYIR